MTDLEDVVVAPRRIAGIDNLVVRRLGLDPNGEPVAFAANTSDLNHAFVLLPLLRRSSARLLNGGSGAGQKPGPTLTRALDGARDTFRQPNRASRVRFEHEREGATLAVERGQQLRPAVGGREH